MLLKISQNSNENTHTEVSFEFSCRPSVCNFIGIEKKLRYRCFPVNFGKFCRTFVIEHLQATVFKISKDAFEKCFLLKIMPTLLIHVFHWGYLKLTSPDHISSKYQLMLLIFKVSCHDHYSFQNVSFSLMEKSMAVDWRFSAKKFLDSMVRVFLIVLPFLRIAIDLLLPWPVSLISTSRKVNRT